LYQYAAESGDKSAGRIFRHFSAIAGYRMKILIVDDNAGMRRLLRRAVQENASAVWECSDGADALAAYAERQPDIVLMDIRMPRMDGLAAARQICQFDPSARVVMVTDYDDEDLRAAAQEAGACGYVLKQNLIALSNLVRSSMGD
jgi:DNA-binding NarL/FixJ family response regulator